MELHLPGKRMPIRKSYRKMRLKSIGCACRIKLFVIEVEGKILGTYYIKTDQAGPGSHVCNCGYMIEIEFQGI